MLIIRPALFSLTLVVQTTAYGQTFRTFHGASPQPFETIQTDLADPTERIDPAGPAPRSQNMQGPFPPSVTAAPATRDDVYRRVKDRLSGSAVPDDFIQEALYDPATRILEEVADRFKAPAEHLTYEQYRRIFITEERIRRGARFALEYQAPLEAVQERLQADPPLLVSLSGVESYYGRHTGAFPVLSSLYTIALRLPDRSDWAIRELAEYLKLCHGGKIDPRGIRGSYAGAFGYFQFLPSSFNAYAVDFDMDGKRRHDDWPDVLGSMANFLKMNGYAPDGDFSQGSKTWKALFAYNHSDNYVRVVLELRQAILDMLSR